ncbi:hypothetical protein [Adhaeribacter rhizoryzae]|uniref:Uncharacterized protein n=1 Tax=Adhaeribacter rhizoryzae TaxID=2607907 RepID=A0A5M6DSU9_9BACT|nr:hypothetical protein [Adhaeribacter rhizoryzae]KAA5549210.1 hypothetical protein F0145_01050 [Adhaeribacter rhizoryzae]
MHLIEIKRRIEKYGPSLEFISEQLPNNTDYRFRASELKKLKNVLSNLEYIPFIQEEVEKLKETWIYRSDDDVQFLSANQNGQVQSLVYKIKTGLDYLYRVAEASTFDGSDNLLYIKLPELKSFEELSKVANDFKKGIEIPIRDESIQGDVNILTAEPGSIWLVVGLGSVMAIKLIAAICWAAAVIKKKNAEAKIFEAHAKTLDLKNEALSTIISAQKNQLNNILANEAEAIANKHYNNQDQSTIERLKLSINTIADLIERGSKILPSSSNEEIQKSFPDYNALNLIESSIKNLMEKN